MIRRLDDLDVLGEQHSVEASQIVDGPLDLQAVVLEAEASVFRAALRADQREVVMLAAEGQEDPSRSTSDDLHAQHVGEPGAGQIRVADEQRQVSSRDDGLDVQPARGRCLACRPP